MEQVRTYIVRATLHACAPHVHLCVVWTPELIFHTSHCWTESTKVWPVWLDPNVNVCTMAVTHDVEDWVWTQDYHTRIYIHMYVQQYHFTHVCRHTSKYCACYNRYVCVHVDADKQEDWDLLTTMCECVCWVLSHINFVYVAQFHHSADGFQSCLQRQGPEDRQMGQNLQRCEILLMEFHVTIALLLFLYLLTSCLLFYHCTPHCLAAWCTDLFSTWEKGE